MFYSACNVYLNGGVSVLLGGAKAREQKLSAAVEVDAIARTVKNVNTGALDYAMKQLLSKSNAGSLEKMSINKDEFRDVLIRARGGQEVDLIYDIFDSSGDNLLQYEELRDVVKKDIIN